MNNDIQSLSDWYKSKSVETLNPRLQLVRTNDSRERTGYAFGQYCLEPYRDQLTNQSKKWLKLTPKVDEQTGLTYLKVTIVNVEEANPIESDSFYWSCEDDSVLLFMKKVFSHVMISKDDFAKIQKSVDFDESFYKQIGLKFMTFVKESAFRLPVQENIKTTSAEELLKIDEKQLDLEWIKLYLKLTDD